MCDIRYVTDIKLITLSVYAVTLNLRRWATISDSEEKVPDYPRRACHYHITHLISHQTRIGNFSRYTIELKISSEYDASFFSYILMLFSEFSVDNANVNFEILYIAK